MAVSPEALLVMLGEAGRKNISFHFPFDFTEYREGEYFRPYEMTKILKDKASPDVQDREGSTPQKQIIS